MANTNFSSKELIQKDFKRKGLPTTIYEAKKRKPPSKTFYDTKRNKELAAVTKEDLRKMGLDPNHKDSLRMYLNIRDNKTARTPYSDDVWLPGKGPKDKKTDVKPKKQSDSSITKQKYQDSTTQVKQKEVKASNKKEEAVDSLMDKGVNFIKRNPDLLLLLVPGVGLGAVAGRKVATGVLKYALKKFGKKGVNKVKELKKLTYKKPEIKKLTGKKPKQLTFEKKESAASKKLGKLLSKKLDEYGKKQSKSKVVKTAKPKVVKTDKPKVVKTDKPKVVKKEEPKVVKTAKPKVVKTEKPKVVKKEEPKVVKTVKKEQPGKKIDINLMITKNTYNQFKNNPAETTKKIMNSEMSRANKTGLIGTLQDIVNFKKKNPGASLEFAIAKVTGKKQKFLKRGGVIKRKTGGIARRKTGGIVRRQTGGYIGVGKALRGYGAVTRKKGGKVAY